MALVDWDDDSRKFLLVRTTEADIRLPANVVAQIIDAAKMPMPIGMVAPVVLGEDDLMWQHHSGGSRHTGMPWSEGSAVDDAAHILDHINSLMLGKLFDLVRSEPGRTFTPDEIIEVLPEFTSAKAVAGALNGFVLPCEKTRRPFPFFWWEGVNGSPSRYAVRPSVAKTFAAAGH
jgi:hypothetical protein